MDRTACVDVPALPLQLLLRRDPRRAAGPAAVVEKDRPQALVLWINDAARRGGVRTGMRYGAALSLAPTLFAGTVPPEEVAAGVASLVERLFSFTPGVESSKEEPGVFFLDASGLARLCGPSAAWAKALRNDLAQAGFRARVAVGFTRFGVFAAARTARDVVVFADCEEEDSAAARAPLSRLGVEPSLRDRLEKLGVVTAGDFCRLPADGILTRFGPEARRLHDFASGSFAPPLVRAVASAPLEERVRSEHPETDATRLAFVVKRLLDPLLSQAAARGETVAGLTLRLELDRGAAIEERVRPATPTLEAAQLLDLLHLKLAAIRLPCGVVEAALSAETIRATSSQIGLFAERPRRDPAAAARAFARLTAEFGEGAVVVARLVEGHLPEARFAWTPLDGTQPPSSRPRLVPDPPLVRRILERPRALASAESRGPDGWLPLGCEEGPVVRLDGPYVVVGGWWRGRETRREHHFAETSGGRLLWVFRESDGRRWRLQGRVE